MLEEVRCLKVKELKNQLEQLRIEYAAMFDEVNAINGQIWVLRYAEKQVKNYESQKHPIWERLTKRKNYLAYQANLATLKNSREKMVSLTNRLAHAEIQAMETVAESAIQQKIEKLENAIQMVKSATSLDQLGLTPMQAVNLLQTNGLTPIWGDGDFEIYARMHRSNDEAELVVVNEIDQSLKDVRLTRIGNFNFDHGKKVPVTEKIY